MSADRPRGPGSLQAPLSKLAGTSPTRWRPLQVTDVHTTQEARDQSCWVQVQGLPRAQEDQLHCLSAWAERLSSE